MLGSLNRLIFHHTLTHTLSEVDPAEVKMLKQQIKGSVCVLLPPSLPLSPSPLSLHLSPSPSISPPLPPSLPLSLPLPPPSFPLSPSLPLPLSPLPPSPSLPLPLSSPLPPSLALRSDYTSAHAHISTCVYFLSHFLPQEVLKLLTVSTDHYNSTRLNTFTSRSS